MAKAGSPNLSVSTQLQVSLPVAESGVIIPAAQWDTIMSRIDECRDHTDHYTAIAWAAFGAGLSALISAVTFLFSTRFVEPIEGGGERIVWGALVSEVLCVIVAVCGLITWVMTLKFAKQHRSDQGKLRSWILQDMKAVRDRQLPNGTDLKPEPAAS